MTSSSSPTIDVILNININNCSIDKDDSYKYVSTTDNDARSPGSKRPTAICIDINVQAPRESHNNHAATTKSLMLQQVQALELCRSVQRGDFEEGVTRGIVEGYGW
eukprot:scaffold172142_cov73-Cyclotella_meneghiniana.AAC.1